MDSTLRMVLEREKAALEAKRQELEEEIARLQAENEDISYRLGHVIALIKEPGVEVIAENKHANLQAVESTEETKDPVEITLEILEERGTEPMHYRELADLVMQRGGDLEGSDPALTLVSRLVLDDRFVRPFRRGWYALRAHYPKARSVGKRRKPRRKPSQTRTRNR